MGVFIMDVDGSDVRQLTHGTSYYVSIVDWSPDGACLAILESFEDGTPDSLVIIEIDGGN